MRSSPSAARACGSYGMPPALRADREDRGRAGGRCAGAAGLPHRRFAGSGAASEVRDQRLVYFTYNKAGEVSATNPQQRQSAIDAGARQVRRQGADQRPGAVRRRLEQRRQRIAHRLRTGWTALHHHRRAVWRAGAGHELGLRQGASSARRRDACRRTIRSSGKHGLSAGDVLDGPSRSAGPHHPSGDRRGADRRARSEWRRRGQRDPAGQQLRMAEVELRTRLRGAALSDAPLGPGIEQPLILWIPSIAPTGLTFYTSDRIPGVEGQPVRRQRAPRRGPAHRRPGARGGQRQDGRVAA